MEGTPGLKKPRREAAAPAAADDGARLVGRDYKVEVSGKLFDVKVSARPRRRRRAAAGGRKPPKRERKAGGGDAPRASRSPRRSRARS